MTYTHRVPSHAGPRPRDSRPRIQDCEWLVRERNPGVTEHLLRADGARECVLQSQ